MVLPVPIQDDSKVLKRPPPTEPVPGLPILNQQTNRPLKVLVLGQVDIMRLRGLHLFLQHLHVVYDNRYAQGALEGVLDHLLSSIVEHRGGFTLANPVHQMKMFLYAKEN
jgi:hypothetical protein